MNIKPSSQIAIIKRQEELWTNTMYEAEVQVRVAKKIGNSQLEEEATTRIEEAIRALDELAIMLGEALESAAEAEAAAVLAE